MHQDSARSGNITPVGEIIVATTSHNQAILDANLRQSPCIASGQLALHVEMNAPSASIAYNRLLDRTDAPIIVFAHHDVFLPLGWDALLQKRIREVTAIHPDWAVLAPYGVSCDGQGLGPVWSSSLGSIVGRVATGPIPVQSVDELMIVVRRDAGIRFDDSLPGFHLYGTDIVQTALAKSRGAYAIPLPVIHNDGYKVQLDASFRAAYRHQQQKWRDRLPIICPTTKISRHGLHLWRTRWQIVRSQEIREDMALSTTEAPDVYADLCGWANLTPSDIEDIAGSDINS